MAITIGGASIPITNPAVDSPALFEPFLRMFDGQAQLVGTSSGQAAAGAVTVVPGSAISVFQFTALAGSTLTLPAATGSLMKIFAYVETLATTNSHKMITSPLTDVFVGGIPIVRTDTAAVLAFMAASTSNTISLNRTSSGSVSKGEWLLAQDVASGIWQISGFLSATGAQATPFSHT